MDVIIAIVVIIVLTIAIVWAIDKFVPKKLKPFINILLWIIIIGLSYMTYMSVYKEIQFNDLKEKRFKVVIDRLIDIRDSQLAYKNVNGTYTDDFGKLINFVENGEVPITQRRDTLVLDVEKTKQFLGVETFKTRTLIDTLDYWSVKDSLFDGGDRYKTMMNVFTDKKMAKDYSEWANKLPSGNEKEKEYKKLMQDGSKFTLKAGKLDDFSVFESSVEKAVLLFDQEKYLIEKENQVVSVDGVNGPTLKVGSMEEVFTKGNWPKSYTNKE